MWGWFGGAAAQKRKDSPKNAILGLRSQMDMLQKRERHLQSQIDEQHEIARKNVNTNKNAAKKALRSKKTHEHSLEQTVAQIGTLEQQINSLESANINKETLVVMENAGKAMKTIHGNLNPEKVDDIMDAVREQTMISAEIGQAIADAQIGEPIDEADLDDELEQLQQEDLDEQILTAGTVPVDRLPRVSDKEPVSSKVAATEEEDDEEAELRKLQAEMAM